MAGQLRPNCPRHHVLAIPSGDVKLHFNEVFVVGSAIACLHVCGNIIWHGILIHVPLHMRNATHSPDLLDDLLLAHLEETRVDVGCIAVKQIFAGAECDGTGCLANRVRPEEATSHADGQDIGIIEVVGRRLVLDLSVGLVRDERAVSDRVHVVALGELMPLEIPLTACALPTGTGRESSSCDRADGRRLREAPPAGSISRASRGESIMVCTTLAGWGRAHCHGAQ